MAMGRRKRHRQEPMWVAASEVARSPGHPFYERLNRMLAEAEFDAFAERECAKFYADRMGRPSLPPGVYFRLLLRTLCGAGTPRALHKLPAALREALLRVLAALRRGLATDRALRWLYDTTFAALRRAVHRYHELPT